MTFQDIWNQLVRKNPAIAENGKTVEFQSENLKRLLRQVYEQGERKGKSDAEAIHTAAANAPQSNPFNPFDGIFDGR